MLEILYEEKFNYKSNFDDFKEKYSIDDFNMGIMIKAQQFLRDTDYIHKQWNEESELNLKHYRDKNDYLNILKERQIAREVIRNIKNK